MHGINGHRWQQGLFVCHIIYWHYNIMLILCIQRRAANEAKYEISVFQKYFKISIVFQSYIISLRFQYLRFMCIME